MELLYTRGYKVNRLISFIAAVLFALLAACMTSIYFFSTDLSYFYRAYISAAVFIISYLYFTRKYRKRRYIMHRPAREEWNDILLKYVPYYRMLDNYDRFYFMKKAEIFLEEVLVTGINTEIDDVIRLLVASAAVIPVFRIPDWEYYNLTDVFICDNTLNDHIEIINGNEQVSGLVVYNKSSVYLSKETLTKNFLKTDGYNVGIHEFIHKIDECSGAIDGVLPAPLLSAKERNRWLQIIDYEISKLQNRQSDMREYAGTNRAEFIAIASELFFEKPLEMKQKHHSLYLMMEKIFRQDLASICTSETKKIFRN